MTNEEIQKEKQSIVELINQGKWWIDKLNNRLQELETVQPSEP